MQYSSMPTSAESFRFGVVAKGVYMHHLIALALVVQIAQVEPARAKYVPLKAPRSLNHSVLKCDNDGLAVCLKNVDEEFGTCDSGCQSEFNDDPSGYAECRDGCRGQHDEERNSCFDEYCQSPDGNGK
jgi:hypothetical protein